MTMRSCLLSTPVYEPSHVFCAVICCKKRWHWRSWYHELSGRQSSWETYCWNQVPKGWVFLGGFKNFLILGKIPNLTNIFFKWVGSTTTYVSVCFILFLSCNGESFKTAPILANQQKICLFRPWIHLYIYIWFMWHSVYISDSIHIFNSFRYLCCFHNQSGSKKNSFLS